jgi:hypothetical protein
MPSRWGPTHDEEKKKYLIDLDDDCFFLTARRRDLARETGRDTATRIRALGGVDTTPGPRTRGAHGTG